MTRTVIQLLLLVQLNLFGQNAQVDTLSIQKKEKFTNSQSDKLKFPIIRTNNKQIDSLINFDLKNRFTNHEFEEMQIDSAIIKWADDQIIFLDFIVTYNHKGILSLNISAEGCGAYCSSWTEYYNYSTITGKLLTINKVIDLQKFKPIVLLEKNKQYDEQRKELKRTLLDKKAKLDTQSYEWALEYYNNCDQSFKLESFALHNSYLEIIESCSLPNAIKNLTPLIELKYKYDDIKQFMKIKN